MPTSTNTIHEVLFQKKNKNRNQSSLLLIHILVESLISNSVFERRTSTKRETFSFFICLDAAKFVWLSVFTLTETICRKIWVNPVPTAQECKKSTYGWHASLKNVFS